LRARDFQLLELTAFQPRTLRLLAAELSPHLAVEAIAAAQHFLAHGLNGPRQQPLQGAYGFSEKDFSN
jgi:hypothetical protein